MEEKTKYNGIWYNKKKYYIVSDVIHALEKDGVIEIGKGLIPYTRKGGELTFGEFRDKLKEEGLLGFKTWRISEMRQKGKDDN